MRYKLANSPFMCLLVKSNLNDVSKASNARSNSDFSARSTRIPRPSTKKSIEEPEEPDLFATLAADKRYGFAQDLLRFPGAPQRIFIVQPKLKLFVPENVIANTKSLTTPEMQLEENKTLLDTLGWIVVDYMILNVASYDSKHIFGSGNFEKLEHAVKNAHAVSGVFIGTNILKGKQLRVMKEAFRMPIYDRYRIVLEIFRRHAKTKEAKLQVALAEVPYVRAAVLGNQDEFAESSISRPSNNGHGGASGESWKVVQNKMLRDREGKIRASLDQLRENRIRLRENRLKNQIPSIAIVGYTNSGKTSLVKALTNDERLVPEDKLFATLDVTSHAGVLPNNVTALYMDTIGFISDIPTMLIASFAAVLEEMLLADVLVHVRDISHPETKRQKVTVLQQLRDLNLPEKLINNVIEVCNKCDKIPRVSWNPEAVDADPKALFVSATNGTNIYALRERMEEVLLRDSHFSEKTFRVPQSGKELSWLYREAHVHFIEADAADNEFLLVHVTITSAAFLKFVHQFKKVQVRNKAHQVLKSQSH